MGHKTCSPFPGDFPLPQGSETELLSGCEILEGSGSSPSLTLASRTDLFFSVRAFLDVSLHFDRNSAKHAFNTEVLQALYVFFLEGLQFMRKTPAAHLPTWVAHPPSFILSKSPLIRTGADIGFFYKILVVSLVSLHCCPTSSRGSKGLIFSHTLLHGTLPRPSCEAIAFLTESEVGKKDIRDYTDTP